MYFAGRRFLHYGYVLNLKSTLLFTLQIIRIMIKKKKRAIDLAALQFNNAALHKKMKHQDIFQQYFNNNTDTDR